MIQTEDIVWRPVIESGKSRFDYDGFKSWVCASDDDRVADYILFQIIFGFAENRSGEDFIAEILGDLLLFGYSVPAQELEEFIADKKEFLSTEAQAAREALAGFAQGINVFDLLPQIQKTLSDR